MVGTGWAAGFVLGCLSGPYVVRRVGHIRAFSCSAACAAIIILLNGLIVIPAAWVLFRALSGFFLAGAFMIIESWLNERATNESRGTIFAVYLSVTYFAITLGQFSLAAGDPRTATLFMAGAILFCLAVLPTRAVHCRLPQAAGAGQPQLPKLFRNSPVAVITVLLVGVINGAFGSLAPVFGARIGLSTPLIAAMMSIAVVSGALTQVPAGRLSDRTDRRYIIAGTALAAALAGVGLYSLQPADPLPVLFLTAAYGAFTYPIYGLAVAQANDYTEQAISSPCPAACCCFTASAQ
jgi:MFS family permease